MLSERLDVAQWHVVDEDAALKIFRERIRPDEADEEDDDEYDGFDGYVEACAKIAREHPGDGIVLYLEDGLNAADIEKLQSSI